MSSFHVEHRFVTSVLYELPFGVGRRFLNTGGVASAVLGGWELSSIVAIQSGFPITVMVGQDQSNTGAGFDRPNATGQPVELARGTPRSWFNTAAFSLPPFGAHGDGGRNTVIGPGLLQLDTSLLKYFRFTETKSLQFRFEAFNAPNHPNWGNPNTTFISSSFGKILSTRTTMRELQFGLKFIF